MSFQQIHTRLSSPLYEELKTIASDHQLSISKMFEMIIKKFIEDHRKQQLTKEFDRYVDEMGEHSSEITEEFEPMVTKKLLEDTEW